MLTKNPESPLSPFLRIVLRLSQAAMNSQFVDEATKVINEPQVLINMVSQRVRQLTSGSRPLILVEPRMGLADIALAEIAQGKIGYKTKSEEDSFQL